MVLIAIVVAFAAHMLIGYGIPTQTMNAGVYETVSTQHCGVEYYTIRPYNEPGFYCGVY